MQKLILILVFLFFLTSASFSQFVQTNGPSGGNFSKVDYYNGKIITVTPNGTLFKNNGEEWSHKGSVEYPMGFSITADADYYWTYGTFFKSTDNGASWDTVLTGDRVIVVECNDDNIYVELDDSLMLSTDNAVSWSSPVVSQYANTILFGEPTVQKLQDIKALHRTDETIILECTTSVYPLPKGLYVSSNNGADWQFAEGFPHNVSGVDFTEFNGKIYYASSSGIFTSSDKGFNWEDATNGIPSNLGNYSFIKFHVYNNTLYVASAYGQTVYRLDGDTWSVLKALTPFNDLSFEGENLYLATQTGIIRMNLTTLDESNLTDNMIATYSPVFPKNESVAFALAYNKIYRTTNSGENWSMLQTNYKTNSMFVTNDAVYSADENGMRKSTDNGENWSSISNSFNVYYTQSCRGFTEVNGVIYATFNKIRPRTHLTPVWEAGGIYKSVNGGNSWINISGNLPSEAGIPAPVNGMAITDGQIILKTIEGIFRSVDGGNSWSLFEENIPNVNYLGTLKAYNDKIIGVTYTGLIYSVPENNEWLDLNSGLPEEMNFHAIVMFTHNGKLYLYSNEEEFLKSLNGNEWVDEDYVFNSLNKYKKFVSTGNIIWASVNDKGVWKGMLEGTTATNQLAYNQGWNLISVPTSQTGSSFSDIFDKINGSVYSYNGSYVQATTPQAGNGYWANFSEAENIMLSGNIIDQSLTLSEGWNIIGPFHNETDISAIIPDNENLIVSDYFGFNGSYSSAETLEPGKGYWVKTSQAGTISFGNPDPDNTENFDLSEAAHISFNFNISEANTATYIAGIYAGATIGTDPELGESLMPPLPPAGASDIRFINADNEEVNMDIRPENESGKYQYNMKITSDKKLSFIPVFNGNIEATISYNNQTVTLQNNGEITLPAKIDNGIVQVVISTDGITSVENSEMPTEFNLYSNYPNPFNPSTNIKFDLPETSDIRLTVYDILGNEIIRLAEGTVNAGIYNKTFDASGLSSGIYLLKMDAKGISGKNYNKITKMILMK